MAIIPTQDRDMATAWWSALVSTVPKEVKGLWFGLTKLVVDGGAATTLYVAGSADFDIDDATGDWASAIVWWPEDRYATLPGLAAIPAADWRRALDYVSELVGDTVDPDALPPSVIGVGLGWDDGDAKIIRARS